jgi:hypothetical protein
LLDVQAVACCQAVPEHDDRASGGVGLAICGLGGRQELGEGNEDG